MKTRSRITVALLRRLLKYDPLTGVFIWLERTTDLFVSVVSRLPERECRRWNARYAGKEAGAVRDNGYRYIGADGRSYAASRLAWLWVTGEWPENEIDHIDLNRSNDQWNNLRKATRSENSSNRHAYRNNTCGLKGVYWHKISGKWRAALQVRGEKINLGSFSSPESAHIAYLEAAKRYFGEYARGTNRSEVVR